MTVYFKDLNEQRDPLDALGNREQEKQKNGGRKVFTQDHTQTHKHKGIYSRWTDKVVNPHMTLTLVLQTHRSVSQRTHLESDTLMPT